MLWQVENRIPNIDIPSRLLYVTMALVSDIAIPGYRGVVMVKVGI